MFKHWLATVYLLLSIVIESNFAIANDEVCQSKTCIEVANNIKSVANLQADPCKDFYQFACGKRMSARTLSSRAHEEALNNRNSMKRLLDAEPDNPNMLALASYHSSCVTGAKQNHSSILKLIDRVTSSSSLEDVTKVACKIQAEGLSSPLFSIETTFNELSGDTSQMLLKLAPRHFSNKRNFADFVSLLELTSLINKTHLVKVDKLRNQLIQLSEKKFPNKPELISLEELGSEVMPSINWTYLMMINYQNKDFSSQQILVTNRHYMSALNELLGGQDARDLSNFMILQMVDEAATYAGDKLRSLASQKLPRLCIDSLIEQLGYLFSFEYGRHFVSDQNRAEVLKMVELISDELEMQVDSADWLGDETRSEAKQKVKAIQALVGYPQQFLQDTSLLQRISGLGGGQKFAPDSYLDNVLQLKRDEFAFDASLLSQDSGQVSYRQLAWLRFRDSTSVTAFYEDAFNSINLLAGQLNQVLFDELRPAHVNYAIIGSIIGHELVHSFDRSGVQVDASGRKRIWWDVDSRLGYEMRLDCVRQLYEGLNISGTSLRINGTRTLDENLADLIGLKLAYKAFKRLDNTKHARLPGLEQFNSEQTFWLSYGARWCDSATPEQMAKQYAGDSHSPEPLRVNVPLQNSVEFAKAFTCPIGSNMNPGGGWDETCESFFGTSV